MELLCDELLLNICQYLQAFDLIHLASAYPRLQSLILERRLWRWINGTQRLASANEVKFFNSKVNSHTVAYLISSKTSFITRALLRKWKAFDALSVLALENQTIQSENVTLCDFPTTLTELSLNKCSFTFYYSFFQYCSYKLTNLRVLTLEYCQSIEEHVLTPLGHLPELEILSLNGCMSCMDSMVPIMMGFQSGFNKLKVLDVRCTGFGDELLRFATQKHDLGEMYFQSYFNYACGHLRAGSDAARKKNVMDFATKVSARGFDHYRKCCSRPEEYEPPESILYTRPFSACTCRNAFPPVSLPSNIVGGKRAHSPSSPTSEEPPKRRHTADSDSEDTEESTKPIDSDNPTTAFSVRFVFPDGNVISGESRAPLHRRAENHPSEHVYLQLPERPHYVPNFDLPVVINRYNRNAFERHHLIAMNTLMLRGFPIGDDAIDSLRQLRLDFIDVTDTNVTQAGLRRLRMAMPSHCRIVHPLYCQCKPRVECSPRGS